MQHVRRASRILAIAACLSAPSLTEAREFKVGALVIEQPWARATPGGAQVAGGYLTVHNRGATPDTLTGGSFEAAAEFELHEMTHENGMMGMRPTGPLPIPPGATLVLEPSGKHVMLMGLKHGLTKGELIGGTLTFEHAGTLPVQFEVEDIGAKTPARADNP